MKKIIVILFVLLSVRLSAQNLYFPPNTGNTWDTLAPQSLGYCQASIDSLYNFLERNNTKAFILLKGGKIVLEKYFGLHTQNTPWQWASAGKTITSMMVGVAQQEGFLSINDTTSKYIGKGWTNCSVLQEDKITIRNQLSMTSGLDDGVADPYCTIDTCLIFKANAGTRWAYHNAPYTLLDSVIESATGQSLNTYTSLKLKNPTGMTGAFLSIGFNNTYYSTARSMARFGLLILNKGKWNGNIILSDTNYYNQMLNTSQLLNKSYGYLWWLNGKTSFMVPSSQFVFNGSLCPNAPTDLVSAMGKGGQFLNIIPSQQLVWLRMGDDPTNALVPFLFNNDIWQYINRLPCSTSTVNSTNIEEALVKLFPNPCKHELYLNSHETQSKIELFSFQGQCIKSFDVITKESKIEIEDLPNAFYFIKVYFQNGLVWNGRFIKY